MNSFTDAGKQYRYEMFLKEMRRLSEGATDEQLKIAYKYMSVIKKMYGWAEVNDFFMAFTHGERSIIPLSGC